jgi:hypothetical protein
VVTPLVELFVRTVRFNGIKDVVYLDNNEEKLRT